MKTNRPKDDSCLYYNFLYSLSDYVDEKVKKRHPNAIRFVEKFQKNKIELTEKLFGEYNKNVFDGKLPTMEIKWNKRLLTTAGYCKYMTNKITKDHKATIDLSDKVCDTAQRLRDVLLHEMCHAAVWLLNKRREGHGPCWKFWAGLAINRYPNLPKVSVCHNYAITKRFLYTCNNCNYQ